MLRSDVYILHTDTVSKGSYGHHFRTWQKEREKEKGTVCAHLWVTGCSAGYMFNFQSLRVTL